MKANYTLAYMKANYTLAFIINPYFQSYGYHVYLYNYINNFNFPTFNKYTDENWVKCYKMYAHLK